MADQFTTPIRKVLSALKNVNDKGTTERGHQYSAQCPCHDDNTNSLSVLDSRSGNVDVYCHACGADYRACASAIGIDYLEFFANKYRRNDNWPTKQGINNNTNPSGTTSSSKNKPRPKLVATYDYCDEQGTLLIQSCRYEPKDFRQRSPNPSGNGGWIWSVKDVRRTLYRFPELLAAKADAAARGERCRVVVTEGEKDVDRLRSIGFTATTNLGGAAKMNPSTKSHDAKSAAKNSPLDIRNSKWLDEYSQQLIGCDISLIPDNDDVGRDHCEIIARSIYRAAATTDQLNATSIRILSLAQHLISIPPKGDVSDYLNHYRDEFRVSSSNPDAIESPEAIETLHGLVQSAPEWTPPDSVNITQSKAVVIESDDDPHRLAKINLATYAKHRDGATLRYWRDEWYKYDGHCYRKIEEEELRPKLITAIKEEFDRINLIRQQEADDTIPVASKVTKGLITNVLEAQKSLAIIPSSVELGTWMRRDEFHRQRKSYIALQNGILDIDAVLADRDIDECLLQHSPDWFSYSQFERIDDDS